MEIHKPKPWHGLREFLKEYLIVVIGVLTALGAEQAVERLHWNDRLAETRTQLKSELTGDAKNGIYWLTVAPCLDQQLDALSKRVGDARRSGNFTPLPARYAPPLTMFKSDAWLNARSLQVSDHLSAEEVRGYSTTYFFPTELKDSMLLIRQLAAGLEPLTQPLDHITPAEADDLTARIGQARELQSRMNMAAILMVIDARQFGVAPRAEDLEAAFAADRRQLGACVADPAHVVKLVQSTRAADVLSLYPQLNLSAPY